MDRTCYFSFTAKCLHCYTFQVARLGWPASAIHFACIRPIRPKVNCTATSQLLSEVVNIDQTIGVTRSCSSRSYALLLKPMAGLGAHGSVNEHRDVGY